MKPIYKKIPPNKGTFFLSIKFNLFPNLFPYLKKIKKSTGIKVVKKICISYLFIKVFIIINGKLTSDTNNLIILKLNLLE